MNILDTITLAGALILALPIGMLGVEFLATGRPIAGIGFVAVAVALVLGQHYLEPDVKGRIAGGIVDIVVPDEGEGTDSADAEQAAADAQPTADDEEVQRT